MYRTIPIRAKLTEEEEAYWVDQCKHSNSLINCAIYYTKQKHRDWLEQQEGAFTTYWRSDELRCGWKLYRSNTIYPELDKELKNNPRYKVLAAQSQQPSLLILGITSICSSLLPQQRHW